jgi:RimJ/RimL family protein N-acetyltransferase
MLFKALPFAFKKNNMIIKFRPFTESDLGSLQKWSTEVNSSHYMSRITPHKFKDNKVKNQLFRWFVINVNSEDIGTVWLEKETVNDNVAIIGILLGENEKLGIGIGQKVIPLVIKQTFQSLSYDFVDLYVRRSNKRAISCYQKCGFEIVDEGQKIRNNGGLIPFLKMRLSLSTFMDSMNHYS